jgi:tetratricopeptide (TPR) repeat protein
MAGARDAAGREADAEQLYRRALELGLDRERAVRARIQLASTLRNLGRADEALALLQVARADAPKRLTGCIAAFEALALLSLGRVQESTALLLRALAPHLPLYGRSVRAYADEIAPEHT